MINLSYEKDKKLTTEQITMILDLAAQAASDGGFISDFIFERAMYVFAAQIFYPDKKDTIASSIGAGYDIRLAFDALVQDGTMEDMFSEYNKDIQYLYGSGMVWLQNVKEFQQSARGLLDSINTLSGDIVQSAAQQLQKVASGDVKKIQDFANHWGFSMPSPGKDE